MLLAILKPLCLVWTVKRLTNTEQWIATCRRCIYKRIHKLIVNVMYSLCVQFSTHSSESSGDLWTEEEGVDHAGRDPGREGCPEEPWLKQHKLDEEALKQQEILYTQVRQLPTWWLRRVGDQDSKLITTPGKEAMWSRAWPSGSGGTSLIIGYEDRNVTRWGVIQSIYPLYCLSC